MKKFFLWMLALTGLAVLTNSMILYRLAYHNCSMTQSIDARLQMLEMDADNPRLVIVGGSSNMRGVINSRLEEAIPYEIVNMGIPRPLGTALMFNQVESHLRPDDVLLLSLEYEHFYGGHYGEPIEMIQTQYFSMFPQQFQYISHSEQFADILRGNARFIRLTTEKLLRNPDLISSTLNRDCTGKPMGYDSANLDPIELGNSVRPTPIPPNNLQVDNYDPTVVEDINALAERLDARGVEVLLKFPVFTQTKAGDPALEHVYQQMQENFNEHVTIIGTPQTWMLPPNVFWDTYYHPDPEGREMHTQQMIELVTPALPRVQQDDS